MPDRAEPCVPSGASANDQATPSPLPPTDPASGPGSSPAVPDPAGRRVGRYELLGEIASGGMGTVWRAFDPEIGRELAVKLLRPELRDNGVLVQRFFGEAKITGRLQHPGVVPVHELGTAPDGTPFLAMKLIKGRTLSELLAERPNPAHDLPRFVAIFEQICQALAYAHARRVIHRDLKSSNVMVGAFGEVQVMDWGLAKVVPEAGGPTDVPSDTEPGTVIRSPQEEDGVEPTRYGSVLGTYAYMPPEQARGWVGEVDRRSDVFALGAILCDILTGKPPYPGPSRREMQIQAFEADLSGAFARLEACGADPELVALARHCLAPRKEERPANAGEVAAAVAAHQAAAQERLQAERLERERAQVKAAEERKRRRWQAGLAAAVLGLVVLTGGGWSWWRQQETLRRQGVEAALGRVSDHEARGEWGEARAALQEAAGRLGEGGPADLRERLARAESELALVAKLERIREDRAALVNGEFDHASAAPAYEAAFREAGLDVVAGEVTALAAAVRDSPIRAQLVAALDDWAMVAFAAGDADSRATCERLMRIARAADPDRDLRDRLRDPARWRDRQALKELARSAAGADVPPSLVTVLSSLMQGAGMPAEAEGVLREAQARYPDDFWVNFLLGNALNASRPAEAVGFYRAALAARPGSATAQNNLGIALSRLGDEPRAIRAYERAIELAPDYAVPWYNLAISRKAVGDPDGEIAAYRKALAISPDYARCRYNLGVALLARRDVDGAVECFRRASEHAGAALPAAEDGGPGKPLSARQAPFDLDLSAERKDFEKEKALYNLGRALETRGDIPGALQAYRDAVRVNPGYAKAYNNIGGILKGTGDLHGAVMSYQKAADCAPDDADASLYYRNLGITLYLLNDLDGAEQAMNRAIEFDPANADSYADLGVIFAGKGDAAGALARYREAVEADPRNARAYHNLGIALTRSGDARGGVAAFRKAVELAPGEAWAHHDLGFGLDALGDGDGAVRAFRRAIELDPRHVPAHVSLGLTLKDQGDFEGAEASFRQAVALDPGNASAHISLATALRDQGRFDEARDACRHGLALLSPGAPLRDTARTLLKYVETLRDLDRKLGAVLRGERSPAGPAERLDLAWLCREHRNRYLDAARLYAEAFAEDPKLARDLTLRHRSNAASAALRAAAGEGEGAAELPGPERSRLRRQALGWLRDDLKALRKAAAADARAALEQWRQAPELAAVRDSDKLAALPAEEREEWEKFWADVGALRQQTGAE